MATETAFNRVTAALQAHGSTRRGVNWQCPGHDDSQASMTVTQGAGRVLLNCHACCATEDIVSALGLRMRDLFDEEPSRETEQYDYMDLDGTVLYAKVRYEPKNFSIKHPSGNGWQPGIGDAQRVLYRLPQLVEGISSGKTVYICEGEKDVNRLTREGYVATTNFEGAGKWRADYNQYLEGADVVIVADRDDAGYAHATLVKQNLHGVARNVRIVQSKTGNKKDDVSDHLNSGFKVEELVPVAAETAVTKMYNPVNWFHVWKETGDEPDWLFEPILEAGTVNALFGKPGVGKAVCVETQLPTPAGWTTMGLVQVGDHLIGMNGQPVKVVAATEVMRDRPCYEVEFDDGTVITADADHQWLTETRASRMHRVASQVYTTKEIAGSLRCGGERKNHSVRVAGAFQLPSAYLPLHPYALGVWLGDGNSNCAQLTTADPEILENLAAVGIETKKLSGRYHYRMEFDYTPPGDHPLCDVCGDRLSRKPSGLGMLRELGVLNNKHIPRSYLRASEIQRRALLAGLLDTDGCANHGSAQLGFTSRRLAEDVRELILSLGYRCAWSERRVKGRTEASSIYYRMMFAAREKVFWLPRKHVKHQSEVPGKDSLRAKRRYIVDVREVPSVPVRCVQVEGGMYLAGKSMVPTHNSLITLEMAMSIAKRGHAVVYVDDENRIQDTVERLKAFSCRPEDLDKLFMYSFAGLPALDTPDGGQHLAALAERHEAALVVLDTTSRMVAGDENSASTYLQLYRCSLVPLKSRGVTVLRLDHPGKDDAKGQRGSSAKLGDIDTLWKLSSESEDLLTLEREKSRSGHGESAIIIKRLHNPLRHDWDALESLPVTGEVMGWAQKFDLEGIAPDAGRPTLRAIMDERGWACSNAVLSVVVRYRKKLHFALTSDIRSDTKGRRSVGTSWSDVETPDDNPSPQVDDYVEPPPF